MIGFLVRKIFGSKNDRFLKKLRPLVAKINALEPEMQALADEELPQRLAVYREQVQNGEKDLDAVLPEVFALVREASTRVLGMRHYDVQLLGAMALHNGKIAEMKTGEGKTLVATLAVILNSLEGKGVHVVTVNDYLAKRDAEWMGRLYNFLGLSVGVIVAGLSDEQRKEAYGADITYGTNNEFGFDYLRDNMKFYAEQLVQRGHHYAIVDEVDSILIDEARTPLIISGASDESTDLYQKVDEVVRTLEKEKHYTVDEKGKTASLTDEGVLYVEEQLGIENLYDTANITAQHHVLQSLKAHTVFRRDVDYIVKDDQVVIVDEFTGRLMAGRRFSDGLHQALEAKEHVTVAAAKLLSKAVSLYEDEYAITVPSYGHERRGAPVNTSIIVDREPVLLNSFVYEPDIVVVFDPELIHKKVNVAEGIHPDSVLVLNSERKDVLKAYSEIGFRSIYYVDGTAIAYRHIHRAIPNCSMLGAVAAIGVAGIESVDKAIMETFGEKAGVKNAEAARETFERTRKM